MRTLVRQALAAGESDLDSLAHRLIDAAGTDRSRRYRLLPPELAEREAFAPFWNQSAMAVKTRNRVRRRLLLDIQMEFGLRSGVGRTLESTGSAVATVDVSDTLLRTCAGEALEAAEIQLSTNGPTDAQLFVWVRGVLERMRTRGAIEHEWFNKFRQQDGNRWWVTGRPRSRRRNAGLRQRQFCARLSGARRNRPRHGPRTGRFCSRLVRNLDGEGTRSQRRAKVPCWPACCSADFSAATSSAK